MGVLEKPISIIYFSEPVIADFLAFLYPPLWAIEAFACVSLDQLSDGSRNVGAGVAVMPTEKGFSEWFRAKVGADKIVTINFKGDGEIGPKEIEKMIRVLEAQKLALED